MLSSAPVVQQGKAVSFQSEAAAVAPRKPEAEYDPVHGGPALTPGASRRHVHQDDLEGGLMLQNTQAMQPPASLNSRTTTLEATPLVGSVGTPPRSIVSLR